MTLAMLTPAGAATLGSGGAVVAAQPDQGPPPDQNRIQTPPIPVIAIWLLELAVIIYILSRHHNHPNSPG
jgi:hypothetical protein